MIEIIQKGGEKKTELSAPKILEQLVQQAERAGASDIHLQMRGKSADVAFRLDGVISPVTELPAEIAERVFGRIKFLARLKTYQESLPQDGRIARDELEKFLRQPSGLLLLTGPAGSGKTTTIYACLRQLAEFGGRHIITVED